MYHGSPKRLTKLSSGKRGLFLSPLKGIASIFAIDEVKEFSKSKTFSFNMNYDEWTLPDSKLKNSLKNIHIRHNVPNTKKISGTSTGYIYTIDATNLKLEDFKDNPNSKRELVYFGPKIDYVSIEKIKINWTAEYSKDQENKYGCGRF